MFKLIFLIICLGIFDSGRADDLLGKGLWSLISVGQCSDQSLPIENVQTMQLDVNKHKLNRTQDGITAHISITQTITELNGMYIDVCKFVDGGCKPYQIISDNIGKLSDKYAKEHVKKALQMAKFENEYFPLVKGEYDLEDYMVNYCGLPAVCVYGKFEASVYILSNLQRVACLKLVLECKKCEEDEDCCDDGMVVL